MKTQNQFDLRQKQNIPLDNKFKDLEVHTSTLDEGVQNASFDSFLNNDIDRSNFHQQEDLQNILKSTSKENIDHGRTVLNTFPIMTVVQISPLQDQPFLQLKEMHDSKLINTGLDNTGFGSAEFGDTESMDVESSFDDDKIEQTKFFDVDTPKATPFYIHQNNNELPTIGYPHKSLNDDSSPNNPAHPHFDALHNQKHLDFIKPEEVLPLSKEEENLVKNFVFHKQKESITPFLTYEITEEDHSLKKGRDLTFSHSPSILKTTESPSPLVKKREESIVQTMKKIDHLLGDSHIQDSTENFKNLDEHLDALDSEELKETSYLAIFKDFQNRGTNPSLKIESSFLATAAKHSEFIETLKQEFLSLKNKNDKKLTIHMNDQNRHLTIIFNMNDLKGMNVTFRTKDKDWKRLLERYQNEIHESLQDVETTVQIRYLGV
ncbi:MAG: hypothetical protein HEEMFOPI_01039 [Holosporales bacterium]